MLGRNGFPMMVLTTAMLACATMWCIPTMRAAPPTGDNAGQAAAPAPADKDAQQPQAPADKDDVLISRMRVQDYPAATYCFKQTEATIEQLGAIIPPIMAEMMQLIEEQKIRPQAAPVFVYQGAGPDPGKQFQLQIGVPVADGAAEVGDWKVRKLEPFHCATVIYSGPVMQVGRAYQELFTQLLAAGMQPTGETREMYLYWEGPESPNNVTVIMAGVK